MRLVGGGGGGGGGGVRFLQRPEPLGGSVAVSVASWSAGKVAGWLVG